MIEKLNMFISWVFKPSPRSDMAIVKNHKMSQEERNNINPFLDRPLEKNIRPSSQNQLTKGDIS